MIIRLSIDKNTLEVESSDDSVTVNWVNETSDKIEIEISKPDESIPIAINCTPIIQPSN